MTYILGLPRAVLPARHQSVSLVSISMMSDSFCAMDVKAPWAVVRWCFLQDELENRNRTPPFSVGPLRRDYAPPFPCKRERFHCFRALKNGRSRLSRYFVDSLKRGEGAALSLTGEMQRAARYCRAHWT